MRGLADEMDPCEHVFLLPDNVFGGDVVHQIVQFALDGQTDARYRAELIGSRTDVEGRKKSLI